MDHRIKIVILVMIQISLIIISFLTIVYLESTHILAGNTVNIAGKNRVLTSMAHLELQVIMSDPLANTDRVYFALDKLEKNIYFLKHGGSMLDIQITPLPRQFDVMWNDVAYTFGQYKEMSIEIIQSGERGSERILSTQSMHEAEEANMKLIHQSDALTESIGHSIATYSFDLMSTQVVLGIINVAVHIFMITVIWNILKRYTLNQMRVERFAAIGEFASMMAHDMKNPLGTMRNSVTLIQDYYKDIHDDVRQHIDKELYRINRSIKRMSHQVDDVLNYVHDIRLTLETVSVREIINNAVDTVKIPDGVTLDLPTTDVDLLCDSDKMEFVFSNILLNATHALDNNGTTMGSIVVGLHDGGDVVTITFENSGPPIPKENLGSIFNPLFTTKKHGTGLGLTSCKNIVTQHRGTITVQQKPVVFTIRLPKSVRTNEAK